MRGLRRFWLPVVLAVTTTMASGSPCAQTGPATPSSEPRLALVIGNGAYKDQPLRNPPNDARALGAGLRRLGFTVIERIDAGRRQMEEAVLEFGEKLKEGGVGLFYYAGHGVQARGVNYLVPVDAAITSEASVRVQALDVGLVLDLMSDARNRANVVILDSCRNNPFSAAARGARGLAAIDAARGTLIAYATSPGAVAVDGDGDNSPYTAALVRALEEPGLKVEEMFKRVRAKVVDATQGTQTPWESSSLTGDLVFNITITVKPGASAPAPTPSRDAADVAFWNSVQSSTDPRDFQEYLKRFPRGTFSALAKRRLSERTYEQVMAYILPRSRFDSGPNQGKPYPYRDMPGDRAAAICINWDQHLAQTYGNQPPSDGGIKGWRFVSQQRSVERVRTQVLEQCRANSAGKDCTCEIFDVNDRNALRLPEEVMSRIAGPASAGSGPAAPVAAAPVAAAPVAAATQPTAADRETLRTATHKRIMEKIMSTPADAGPATGIPGGTYAQDPTDRALAACVFWETSSAQSVRIGPFSTGKDANPDRRRRAALDVCNRTKGTRSCSCQLIDEGGANLLELPESFVARAQAKPGG